MKSIRKVYGPYTRRDGRKQVFVIYEDNSRTTISYPKFLMEEHLKRKLRYGEVVHHKDEDFTNDDISNLEVIDQKEHGYLHNYTGGSQMSRLVCLLCGIEFFRPTNHEKHNRKQCKSGPYCGKSCAAKATHW